MSKANLAALQNALNPKAAPKDAPPPKASEAEIPPPGQSAVRYTAPSRAGTTNITAYLHKGYKANLRLIQAKTGDSMQDLIAEALNDLFVKYDVPTLDRE